ncbi:MAG TPA: methyltransferase domain-containing protein [Tepidiformaceae bacterium]|nr:methyltransferase domain-containing protein [Tepidiformaceae bacterium]
MRRRRRVIEARQQWVAGPAAPLARAINSQTGMALITPRAQRIIDLIQLSPGKRYLDIGCGTAAYANLLAARAGMDEPPVTVDLVPGSGPVELLGWPEQLPFRDQSFDCITSLYFLRRLDDDMAHAFARELSRLLAPGGAALVLEVAPVRSNTLNRLHTRLLRAGCGEADLRGWGRLAAQFSEAAFDAIDLVNVGPFLVPPIPRVGVLARRA